MILTIDIGNSRIKYASWLRDKIVARGAAVYAPDGIGDTVDELLSTLEKPVQIFAVCVAGNKLSQQLDEWCLQHWRLSIDYLKTEKQYGNIINAYTDPGQHGADRWAAVVAGHQSFPESSICVIGAGTAVTFDFIGSNAQHMGGYILPSYVTMHKALIGDTTDVKAEHDMEYHRQGIPVNTNDAVNQGLHKLIQAGVREICQLARNEMGDPVKIIITGGYAKTILDYPDMPEMYHEPDLIMQGLYTIMKQQKQ